MDEESIQSNLKMLTKKEKEILRDFKIVNFGTGTSNTSERVKEISFNNTKNFSVIKLESLQERAEFLLLCKRKINIKVETSRTILKNLDCQLLYLILYRGGYFWVSRDGYVLDMEGKLSLLSPGSFLRMFELIGAAIWKQNNKPS